MARKRRLAPSAATEGFVRVRLTWLAASATLVAIGFATALIVVAAVRRVEALTTIALVLAILAFVVQLMVFITQTWQSNTVYAETRSLLAKLDATTSGVHSVMAEQNKEFMRQNQQFSDYLMHELPRRFATSTKSESEPAPSVELSDIERVIADAAAASGAAPESSRIEWPSWSRTPERDDPESERILKMLLTYPPEAEGRKGLAVLSRLNPLTTAHLARFGQDEITSRRAGEAPGLGQRPDGHYPSSQVLLREGLIEEGPIPENYAGVFNRWQHLTESGRQIARLLTARERPVPEYISDFILTS